MGSIFVSLFFVFMLKAIIGFSGVLGMGRYTAHT
jgi:hypothetical protein